MNNTAAAVSTLFLGHTGEWWDFWLLVSVLVVGPLAAAAIGLTTAGSIFAHKREAEAAEGKLEKFTAETERFKVEASGKMADATTAGIAAGRDASDALAKSKGAEAKIAAASASAEKARAETATARADLARSLATIETTKAQAADANARALEAQLSLAQMRAPRTFSPTQQAAIRDVAARHKGIALDVFMAGDSADITPLTDSLTDLLTAGGRWAVNRWTWTGIGPIQAITVLIKPDAKPENAAIAKELIAAIDGNTKGSPQIWPGEWAKFGGMLNGGAFDATRTEIRVVIGSKPL